MLCIKSFALCKLVIAKLYMPLYPAWSLQPTDSGVKCFSGIDFL